MGETKKHLHFQEESFLVFDTPVGIVIRSNCFFPSLISLACGRKRSTMLYCLTRFVVYLYCNCAESCYDEVNEVLNKLKAENKDALDMVNFCSSTIGALATNYAEKGKKVWSISEVSAVLAQVQIVD